MTVKSGDWIEYDTGERGVVRSVRPYFSAIQEYWVEFPGKFESVCSDESKPVKPTFDDMQTWAAAKGMRLERGSADRTPGARSGYILWRRGLWTRCGSLKEVFEKIERHA